MRYKTNNAIQYPSTKIEIRDSNSTKTKLINVYTSGTKVN